MQIYAIHYFIEWNSMQKDLQQPIVIITSLIYQQNSNLYNKVLWVKMFQIMANTYCVISRKDIYQLDQKLKLSFYFVLVEQVYLSLW